MVCKSRRKAGDLSYMYLSLENMVIGKLSCYQVLLVQKGTHEHCLDLLCQNYVIGHISPVSVLQEVLFPHLYQGNKVYKVGVVE